MRSVAAASLAVSLLFAANASTASAFDKPQINWQREYERARAEAETLDRPLLLFFTAKWCPACLRVERTVFVDKRVIEYVGEHFVAVHVDADAAPEVVQAWNVDRLPTALIISSSGSLQGKIEGFRPADRYLADLRSHASATADRSNIKGRAPGVLATGPNKSAQPPTAPNARSENVQWATNNEAKQRLTASEIQLTLQQEPDLAFDGVCVVTMVDGHKVATGDPDFSTCFDGATYWFMGPAELERFRANPMRYAPVHSGHCPVSLVDDEREVAGSLHCAAIYRDRLYFFASLERRRRFQSNPRRYTDDRAAITTRTAGAPSKSNAIDASAATSNTHTKP